MILLSFKLLNPIKADKNPCKWWKESQEKFPLLALYFKANCSFQATSVASERVFSMDTLVLSSHRQSMLADRSANMVILQDYMRKRQNKEAFKLCEVCPQPPHQGAYYKL